MFEKIKDFLSTLEISRVLFFLGFLMFGSSMSLYISSYSGTTAGVMFGGIVVMLLGFLLNVI